uniref:Hypoxia up-regulated protein 1 n=1 Tax=Panagrolaimus davidi TaxID=227884 RepID=A0A914QCE8_9BILA
MTALNYARYISKEDGFIGYKINMTLSREIILRHTSQIQDLDKTYCKIPAGIKLPFTLTFQEEDTGWFIKAYENGYDFSMDKFSVKTPGKNNIIFTIDVNGIYSVETKKVFEWKNLSIAESITIPPKCSKYRTDISTVGIDLGTSKFCSSFIEKNGPILAPLLNLDAFVWNEKPSNVSTTFLPSRVMFDENGEGEIAFEKNCGDIFYDWKMIIGKKYDEIHIDSLWPFNISNFNNTVKLELSTLSKPISKTPQEISSAILKQIKQNFDNHHSAVITIPSNFDESKIKVIAEAANIANWDVIHFITEPIAAAFAYFSMKKVSNNSNIIIINFGGGFLDICIANVCKNQMKILSFDGDESIGAREFDKVLYNYFMNILKAKFNIENINKQILIQKCTDIKHTFSKETNAWLDVSDLDINSTKKIKITKEEFKTLSKNSLSKVKNAILSVTKNSKLQINQLNYVFHVGGGCYMPMIKELLLDIFPNANHQCTDKPDEIVAKGAALYAYYLETRNDLPTWKRWALNTILYLDGRKPEYW